VKENNAEKGLVFDIQRLSWHDGPGIRTLIFLKGCFLRCVWCANPEGQFFRKEMLFDKRKCIKCGECIKVCKNNANKLDTVLNEMILDRDACKLSGNCVNACIVGARLLSGKRYSISELLEIVLKDEIFYRNSGGGVTLSGGEPTFQFEFTLEFLKELKRNNINTAIETCGFTEWEKFKQIAAYSDWVLFDFKNLDNEKHLRFTGVSNKKILNNLKKLLGLKDNVIIRITLVPGFNDMEEEKQRMIEYIKNIRKDIKIEFINYHELGKYKYYLLDRVYDFSKKLN